MNEVRAKTLHGVRRVERRVFIHPLQKQLIIFVRFQGEINFQWSAYESLHIIHSELNAIADIYVIQEFSTVHY